MKSVKKVAAKKAKSTRGKKTEVSPGNVEPKQLASLTPWFIVDEAEDFVGFLVRGLGGSELDRMLRPDGRIARAQVRFGINTVMVSEASAEFPPMPASSCLCVASVDAATARALSAGAQKFDQMLHGEAGVLDGWGNVWWLSQRVEPNSDDRFSRSGGRYLPQMYADPYFPAAQVDQLKAAFQELVRFLESKPRTVDEVQVACDALTQTINGLEDDFDAAGSQIETAARDAIGSTLDAIFSVYGIELDGEKALRHGDW
jgi:PhnB protein